MTRILSWSRESDPRPPPAGEGAPRAPEGPTGALCLFFFIFRRIGKKSALSEARFHVIGFTFNIARKSADFGPCFEGNVAVE